MEISKIENIAFEGGGVRICGHAGAFAAMDKLGVDPKRVAGTSAGAIISCLIALGYTAAEIKDMVFSIDFKKFEDGGIIEKINVIEDYGIFKGDAFLHFIQDKIEKKTGSKYTTFAGFYAGGFKDLTVFASNLNKRELKVFNYENTPNVSVADAVRCSMCIPLFFEAHYIPHDPTTYADGGMILNYPLVHFLDTEKSIGVCFDSFIPNEDNGLKKGEFIKYVKSCVDVMLNTQSAWLKQDKDLLNRSIIIDVHGISSVDFGITNEQKQLLYDSGFNAVKMANFSKIVP